MPSVADIDSVLSSLPDICTRAGHSEIYGIDLSCGSDPVRLIVAKYLTAHNNDLKLASEAIEQTLIWRKEFNPRSAAFEETHNTKFDGLGYITKLDEDVVTWNIYGAAARDAKALFEPLDQFLRWRVGLMERSVELLKIAEYTCDGTVDTKQAIQVHDYLSVSFFKMDPSAKAGSKKTIELMTKHYPETMKRKFFVNVPIIMGWMFSAMRMVLSRETISKFTVISYGNQLAAELGYAEQLPKVYGGQSANDLREMAEPWIVQEKKPQSKLETTA